MTVPRPEGLPPAKHRTISIKELHHVGEDRRPGFHQVRQRVEALEPIRSIPYYFDTGEVGGVQGLQGCTTNDWRPITPRLHVVDLLLNTPLDTGHRTTIEYTTWFNYNRLPSPDHRRRVGALGMESLDITVRFEQDQLPVHVWQAEWDNLERGALPIPESMIEMELERVPAEEELPHVLQVRRIETNPPAETVRGFYWEWPAP